MWCVVFQIRQRAAASLLAAALAICATVPAGAQDLTLAFDGDPKVAYDPAIDACTKIDEPDMNARAFRDASGAITMFALHFVNRPLRGPSLDRVKIDCHVSLDSPLDPDPAHFADRFYLAATWTRDGRDVSALVHEEYHADQHKRCAFTTDLACWYNSVLAFHSIDGGDAFTKASPTVVAAAPFKQDVEQGRHRGFFEPSNMVSDGRYVYVFLSTTGWTGQAAGSCLFRTSDPRDPSLWRAYDGIGFTIRYADPYRHSFDPKPCQVIQPFAYAVGSVVRHVPSKRWIAIFQAAAGGQFPVEGFYTSTSRDLIHWEPSRLMIAGRTLFGDWCKAGDTMLINYPSLLDPDSRSRNFDTIGDHPMLFYTSMHANNCQTDARVLLRQPVDVRPEGDRSALERAR